jgi:transposase-like protein
MSVLSYVHQLFSAEQCQAYVPMLRGRDRPLHCPRCQSCDVRPWGMYHYRPGLKRYWCHGCRRTFNDLTHTLLAQSKRSLAHWILATFLLCLSCSSHRIARELGRPCSHELSLVLATAQYGRLLRDRSPLGRHS